MATERSPYDVNFPAPSEELLGLCYGALSEKITPHELKDLVTYWMINHLSNNELDKLKERDPLWDFEKSFDKSTVQLFMKWGKRVENAKFLPPLLGMNYEAKHFKKQNSEPKERTPAR